MKKIFFVLAAIILSAASLAPFYGAHAEMQLNDKKVPGSKPLSMVSPRES